MVEFQTVQSKIERYYSPLRFEPDLDEFRCPASESHTVFQTTDACEEKARGMGCSELETCKAYQEQKKLQEAHPDLDFSCPELIPKEIRVRVEMVRKGALINP